MIVATKKPTAPVRIKVYAHDGGSLEGTMDRPRALSMIYHMMSPEERIKVRNALRECDARIAEDYSKKLAEAAHG